MLENNNSQGKNTPLRTASVLGEGVKLSPEVPRKDSYPKVKNQYDVSLRMAFMGRSALRTAFGLLMRTFAAPRRPNTINILARTACGKEEVASRRLSTTGKMMPPMDAPGEHKMNSG